MHIRPWRLDNPGRQLDILPARRFSLLDPQPGPLVGIGDADIFVPGFGFGVDMVQNRQGDDPVARRQPDPAHAPGIAALESPHFRHGEADRPAGGGRQQDILPGVAGYDPDQRLAVLQLHGDLAVGHDVDEIGQRIAPHRAAARREHDVEVGPFGLVRQRQDDGNILARLERQHVHHRLAARLRRAERQPVDLELVDHAGGGEEQHRRVGVHDIDLVDEILLLGLHAGAALAAPLLRPVGGERDALDIAAVSEGEDHVLALDQVFDILVEIAVLDRRAARVGVSFLHLAEFVAQDFEHPDARAENVEIVADFLDDLPQVLADLLALHAGQAVQPKIENGARLRFGQPVGAVFADEAAGLRDQRDQRRNVGRRPGAFHQAFPRRGGVGRMADQRHHLVDVGDRDGEAGQRVRLAARLLQQEGGAPDDDLLPEGQKGPEHVEQAHLFRPAAVQRQHVDAEAGLELGEAEELVQHDLGIGVALDLDHQAHAFPVGFVVRAGDALDLPRPGEFADLFEHALLVHLVGNLGEHEVVAAVAALLDLVARAHDDGAPAGAVGLVDAGPAHGEGAGGKVRPGQQLHNVFERGVRLLDQPEAGVDHLAQIVRRDIGRHADGDAAGAVDQQVRIARRQDDRLLARFVVVVLEIDRVAVDIVEQGFRRLRQPRLGVAHGRRRVAVHRTEIALAVDQRQAHGKGLRHAHQRVVDRLVAVGMVFAHHVADDQRRFAVGPVAGVAALTHRIQNAPVDRLEAVAHVRNRPGHDHAHGVIEVGALHLLFDGDGRDIAFGRRRLGQGGAVSLNRRVFRRFPAAETAEIRQYRRLHRHNGEPLRVRSGKHHKN